MEYKGLVFTNHILTRMKERKLRAQDIYWIFSKPDEIKDSKTENAKRFYRYWKGTRYAVVAKKDKDDKWIMLTCWWKDLGFLKTEKRKMNIWQKTWKMIIGR